MTKYTLTFSRAKTKCIVSYSNGQFKKLEYKSGGMKDSFWTSLTKAIPFDEHHIKDVVEKWDNRIQFVKVESGTKTDYTQFLEVYYSFFEDQYNIAPKITAAEGKSLKQSIAYLQKETATNDEALAVWQQIFTNWHKLDEFYQGQNQLKQINGNLTTILIQIKDGKPSNQARQKANSNANDLRESIKG